jgi:hypothetical protein
MNSTEKPSHLFKGPFILYDILYDGIAEKELLFIHPSTQDAPFFSKMSPLSLD